MLLVDNRIGSSYLADPLAQLGIPIYREVDGSLPILTAGDVAFEGRGVDGVAINFGIEFKRLSDLVSSLRTGRLSGEQLPKLLGPRGEYHYAFLLIEGRWKPGPNGEILVPRRGGYAPLHGAMPASEMVKKVLTLSVQGGLRPWWTNGREESLDFISTLYRWGSDKNLNKHLSHLDAHKPQAFLPVSAFRQAVMTWPGLGRSASLAAELAFKGSVTRAASASVDTWAAVTVKGRSKDGKVTEKRLGTAVAARLVAFLGGTSCV